MKYRALKYNTKSQFKTLYLIQNIFITLSSNLIFSVILNAIDSFLLLSCHEEDVNVILNTITILIKIMIMIIRYALRPLRIKT